MLLGQPFHPTPPPRGLPLPSTPPPRGQPVHPSAPLRRQPTFARLLLAGSSHPLRPSPRVEEGSVFLPAGRSGEDAGLPALPVGWADGLPHQGTPKPRPSLTAPISQPRSTENEGHLERSRQGNAYFPPDSVNREYVKESPRTSICPWKGTASYYTVVVDGKENPDAAWYYPAPKDAAANIKDHVAFWKGVTVE